MCVTLYFSCLFGAIGSSFFAIFSALFSCSFPEFGSVLLLEPHWWLNIIKWNFQEWDEEIGLFRGQMRRMQVGEKVAGGFVAFRQMEVKYCKLENWIFSNSKEQNTFLLAYLSKYLQNKQTRKQNIMQASLMRSFSPEQAYKMSSGW